VAATLRRVLGVSGATVVGVGAMLGTGVFAAWTPAYDLAGGALLVALVLAAVVAALNATSTASLARALPAAGGAYAYGREFLGRPAGAVAGYAFVIGKSASAGAAALTIGAYAWPGQERIVKSVRVTAVLIVAVIAVLAWLTAAGVTGLPESPSAGTAAVPGGDLLAAAGILFVAFAGYARITVLGEEVRDPERTIPRAMIVSFAIIIVIYAVLAVLVIRSVSSGIVLGTAPLETIATATRGPMLQVAIRVGAVLAAGAVLLSLLAGIGRTAFAMGRGGDAPRAFAALSSRSVPARAEVLAAALAMLVVLVGGIGFALALSAATILTYYSVAHLAVLARVRRRESPLALAAVAVGGLIGCVAVVVGLLLAAAPG
jgi:APA family basic amino acid/polyamine antiporter